MTLLHEGHNGWGEKYINFKKGKKFHGKAESKLRKKRKDQTSYWMRINNQYPGRILTPEYVYYLPNPFVKSDQYNVTDPYFLRISGRFVQLYISKKGNLECICFCFRGGAAAAPAEGEEGGEEAPAAAPQEGMDTD